jgi:hypothetical protein
LVHVLNDRPLGSAMPLLALVWKHATSLSRAQADPCSLYALPSSTVAFYADLFMSPPA